MEFIVIIIILVILLFGYVFIMTFLNAPKEDSLSDLTDDRPSFDYVANDLTNTMKHAIEHERNQIGVRKQEKAEQERAEKEKEENKEQILLEKKQEILSPLKSALEEIESQIDKRWVRFAFIWRERTKYTRPDISVTIGPSILHFGEDYRTDITWEINCAYDYTYKTVTDRINVSCHVSKDLETDGDQLLESLKRKPSRTINGPYTNDTQEDVINLIANTIVKQVAKYTADEA